MRPVQDEPEALEVDGAPAMGERAREAPSEAEGGETQDRGERQQPQYLGTLL